MPGAILYRQTATLLANQSSVTVTLDHSFPDSNYTITPELPYQTRWSISGKTSSQFVFDVETTNVGNQVISFIIYHE